MLEVNLPQKMITWLEAIAAKTDKPRDYHIQEALARYIEDMEDIAIAQERLKDKDSRLWTQEELEQGLDLED